MLLGAAGAECATAVPGVHGAADADQRQLAVAAALHLGGDAAGAAGRRPESARLPPAEPRAAHAAALRRAHRARLLRLPAGALRGRRRRVRPPGHGRAHLLPGHRLLRRRRRLLFQKGEYHNFVNNKHSLLIFLIVR